MRLYQLFGLVASIFASKALALAVVTTQTQETGAVPTDWFDKSCSDPATDANQDPKVRWYGLDAQRAWSAASMSWDANHTSSYLNFPEYINNFFQGPDNMNCGETTDNSGCNSYLRCEDANHPAGYLIINSMVAIHSTVQNMYDAIQNAAGNIALIMDPFIAAFDPPQDPSIAEKLALDVLMMAYALAAAPIWSNFMKAYPGILSGNLGVVKDAVNPLISNSIGTIKDSGVLGKLIDDGNQIKKYMSGLIYSMANATSHINNMLFNNDPDGRLALSTLVHDGQLVLQTQPKNDIDIQEDIKKALFSKVIPKVWKLKNNQWPFVLMTDAPCSDVWPTSVHKNPRNKMDWLNKDVAKQTYMCIDGKTHFLVMPRTSVTQPSLISPPGMDKLDGKEFGGLTREDLGAVNGFKGNGNYNGWKELDLSNQDSMGTIWDQGCQAAGVVMELPVCDSETAQWNFFALSEDPRANFPCDLNCQTQICPGFQSGWCGVHVRQYQKNEGPGSDTRDYRFDVTLKDNGRNLIGTDALRNIPSGQSGDFKSNLPKLFTIKAPNVDGDAVEMSYDGKSWKSDDSKVCKWGKYDSGHRDGDCGFSC